MQIVMQKLVKVDGKVRTDINYPAGFMGAWRGAPRARSTTTAMTTTTARVLAAGGTCGRGAGVAPWGGLGVRA